ncbi:MAG: ABC transporter permease [Alphaproteobacteria bacterium]|nr:ABC transporter permease [Alphaproteobacteria bacterium]
MTASTWRKIGIITLVHLGFVAFWWVGVIVTDVPAYILPTPWQALQTLQVENFNWWLHFNTTAQEVFGGYILAVIVGVAFAVLFSWFRTANLILMPLLVTLNMIPKVAMAPLFIVWLRFGIETNIVITFTICFFPILLNTDRGMKEVEPDLLDLVRSLHGSRWQIFAKIQLPGALPYIFSGMKVATVLAVAGAIVGEFIQSDRGLGWFMLVTQEALNTDAMVMALLLVTLIGVLLYGAVLLLERIFVVQDARVE